MKTQLTKFLNKNILKFINQKNDVLPARGMVGFIERVVRLFLPASFPTKSGIRRSENKLYIEVKRQKIDLTLTENPLGCSLMVKKLFNKVPIKISSYPNGKDKLKREIAKKFKVATNPIVLGNGAEALIDLVCRVFINQNDKVLIPETTTFLFKRLVILSGGQTVLIPMNRDKTTDIGEIEFFLKKGAKMVILANPNNPSGELIKREKILGLIKKFSQMVFVIDEANIEFTDEKESLINEAPRLNNLVVLRSFSKAFGLAGLRIGFLVTNKEFSRILEEINQPFPVNSPALVSGILALKDEIFLRKTKEFSQKQRIFLVKELAKLGLTVFPSKSNNLLVKIPKKINPDVFLKNLKKADVSIIPGSFFEGLDNSFFRINIQNIKINKKFIKAIKKLLLKQNI